MGIFKPGVKSFIGRGFYHTQIVPGRIQIVDPIGFYIISDYKVHKVTQDVEYLVKNSTQIYNWVNSSMGAKVQNSVIIAERGHGGSWQLAKVEDENFTYIAKVHPDTFAHYEYQNGSEIPIANYEVLTCIAKSEKNPDKKPQKEKSKIFEVFLILLICAGVVGGYVTYNKFDIKRRILFETFRRF